MPKKGDPIDPNVMTAHGFNCTNCQTKLGSHNPPWTKAHGCGNPVDSCETKGNYNGWFVRFDINSKPWHWKYDCPEVSIETHTPSTLTSPAMNHCAACGGFGTHKRGCPQDDPEWYKRFEIKDRIKTNWRGR